MSERKPITKQRSIWRHVGGQELSGVPVDVFYRKVGDGTLRSIVGDEPLGLHMSISFVNHKGEPSRYPTWDEIAHARDALLPADIEFVMFLPKAGEYVAVHDSTFHLHEHPERAA